MMMLDSRRKNYFRSYIHRNQATGSWFDSPGERTGIVAFINHREIESSVSTNLEGSPQESQPYRTTHLVFAKL